MKEIKEFLRRPRHETLGGLCNNISRSSVGKFERNSHTPAILLCIVYVRIPARMGEADNSRNRLALQMTRARKLAGLFARGECS